MHVVLQHLGPGALLRPDDEGYPAPRRALVPAAVGAAGVMLGWLQTVRASDEAHVRLVCFPHAGGSASAYRDLALPPEVEICAVQPPGRGPRRAEPACGSFKELTDAVIEALRPTLEAGMPFAFFGHSFGSLCAVEVTRALTERGFRTPLALFLSAHPAPSKSFGSEQDSLSKASTDEVGPSSHPTRPLRSLHSRMRSIAGAVLLAHAIFLRNPAPVRSIAGALRVAAALRLRAGGAGS